MDQLSAYYIPPRKLHLPHSLLPEILLYPVSALFEQRTC